MNELLKSTDAVDPTPEQLDLIWSYTKKVKVGVVTLFNNERWHSCPMTLVQSDFNDGKLYFFADENSFFVQELLDFKAVVGVIFSHPGENVYVSMSGAALVRDDPELIEKYWDNKLLKWLPQGEEDPSLRVIEIDVHSAEYWDEDRNRLQAAFDKFIHGVSLEGVKINEHERVILN